jgi:hypothetical protein
MSQFVLKINLGNDAMQTGYNIASALTKTARTIEDIGYLLNPEMNGEHGPIMDINGNKVGHWEIE